MGIYRREYVWVNVYIIYFTFFPILFMWIFQICFILRLNKLELTITKPYCKTFSVVYFRHVCWKIKEVSLTLIYS